MIRVTLATPSPAVWERLKAADGVRLNGAMERFAFDAAAVVLDAIRGKLAAPRLADMRRSWRIQKPTTDGTGWVSFVYSDHPRAAFRETGGTVKAGVNNAHCGPRAGQRTKALTIPLPPAQTSTMSKQACEVAKLRWFPPAAGFGGYNRGVLATTVEKFSAKGKHGGKQAGEIKEIFFVLKSQVTVKPTPYYGPAIAETEAKRFEMFSHYAQQALEGTP